MPKEKIVISDTNPEPYDYPQFAVSKKNGTYGKRFYGQRDIEGVPDYCVTTLWTSSFHSPDKYLGTYKVKKTDRKNQDLSRFQIVTEKTPTTIQVEATRVEDDLALRQWVLRMYRWIPASLILSLGVAALIATFIWVK